MTPTRRQFLQGSLAAGATLGLSSWVPAALSTARAGSRKPPSLRLLILGGTGFLGPHTVRAALARGHQMTLFNRGRTNPHLFSDLEKLVGDRDGDLKALEGRSWDAVIDTSGYVPRIVDQSAGLLADAVQQYVFISSISVYADFSQPGMDEDSPVGTLEDPTVEEITGESYGPLKALCEQSAERALPGRVTNVRPGLIVGPDDRSDRWTYWPVRVARGGEVLAPGQPDDPIQWIDVRDLGEWIVHCIEQKVVGVYNATSTPRKHSIGSLLEDCRRTTGSDARFTWVDADFLEGQGIEAWSHMPAWIPPKGEYAGFGLVRTERAEAAGLRHRPAFETVRDTLAWWNEQPEERRAEPRAGLSAEREAEVLAAWHARAGEGG